MTYYVSKVLMREIEVEVMGMRRDMSLETEYGMVGCMPVFRTIEDAEKAYPEDGIIKIETEE